MHADAQLHTASSPDAPAEPAAADERRLAFGALKILAVLAVPVVGGAYWLVGTNGAVSAAIGLSFVLVLFGASAALLAYIVGRAERTGSDAAPTPGSTHGVGLLVLGAMVRLPLYLVALTLLDRVSFIHGRSLAAATGIAVAVTLAYELRMMSRMPRLFWVDATAGRPPATTTDTRSESL